MVLVECSMLLWSVLKSFMVSLLEFSTLNFSKQKLFCHLIIWPLQFLRQSQFSFLYHKKILTRVCYRLNSIRRWISSEEVLRSQEGQSWVLPAISIWSDMNTLRIEQASLWIIQPKWWDCHFNSERKSAQRGALNCKACDLDIDKRLLMRLSNALGSEFDFVWLMPRVAQLQLHWIADKFYRLNNSKRNKLLLETQLNTAKSSNNGKSLKFDFVCKISATHFQHAS